MKKYITAAAVLSLLSGCGAEEDAAPVSFETPQTEADTPFSEEPPELEVSAAGVKITAYPGSYSWSHQDGNGGSVSVNASAGSPTELVDTESPSVVPSVAEVNLQFEEEPLDYRIEIWRENGNIISLPGEIELEGLKGIIVFNVIAEWESGKGNYSFAVDVQS